jgi:hypothetical protein
MANACNINKGDALARGNSVKKELLRKLIRFFMS